MNESESQQPPLKLLAALNKIQGELAALGIGKDKRNKEQGYAYRGIDDVMNELAPRLAKHGVFINPRFSEMIRGERITKSGTSMVAVSLRCEVDFISIEDGSTLKPAPSAYGEAFDSGDKATGKAQSYAYREVLVKTFCIPVNGEDSDATTPPDSLPTGSTPRPPSTYAPPIKTPPATVQAVQKAAPVPEKATEAHKKRAIELLEPARQHATQFFIETGKLLPNETLEDIPSDQWPRSKEEMSWLTEHIREFSETGRLPEPPAKARGQKSEVRGEDDLPMGDQPKLPDSRPRVTGVLAHFTLKEGKKKDGTGWSLWGIKVDDAWYNTFSNTLGQLAQSLKGETVELIYEEGEKGNTALEIKPI